MLYSRLARYIRCFSSSFISAHALSILSCHPLINNLLARRTAISVFIRSNYYLMGYRKQNEYPCHLGQPKSIGFRRWPFCLGLDPNNTNQTKTIERKERRGRENENIAWKSRQWKEINRHLRDIKALISICVVLLKRFYQDKFN
jgi:hypothetical protein